MMARIELSANTLSRHARPSVEERRRSNENVHVFGVDVDGSESVSWKYESIRYSVLFCSMNWRAYVPLVPEMPLRRRSVVGKNGSSGSPIPAGMLKARADDIVCDSHPLLHGKSEYCRT